MKLGWPWATVLAVAAFSASAATLAQPDRDFARKAAEAGMDEVAGGKLAQQRAAHESVRQFAHRMIDDHSRAEDELRKVAGSEGISVPDKLDKSATKDLDRLGKLQGDAFDRAYMKHNVSAHQKVVKEFRKEARSGHDPVLKRYASEMLPVLEEHLKLAQSTARSVDRPKGPAKGEATK